MTNIQEVASILFDMASMVENVIDLTHKLSNRVEVLENQKKENPKKEELPQRENFPTMDVDDFLRDRSDNFPQMSRDVRDFINMECVIDLSAACDISYLYLVYEAWALKTGQRLLARNGFYDQIRAVFVIYGASIQTRASLYVRGLRPKKCEAAR